jgi:hypothetical protein
MLSVEWFLLAPFQGLLICNILPGVRSAHSGLFIPALFRAGAFRIDDEKRNEHRRCGTNSKPQNEKSIFYMLLECRAFSAPFLPDLNPGLTAGPIIFQPFGLHNLNLNLGFEF